DDNAPAATPEQPAAERDEPKPLDAPVPASKTSDDHGSTIVQDPPTINLVTYSGATLADVTGALPEEAGSVQFDFTERTEGNPISTAQLEVKQVLTLPRWAERDGQCKPVQQAWDAFQSAIEKHEQGHLAVDAREFAAAHNRFVGKSPAAVQSESDKLKEKV